VALVAREPQFNRSHVHERIVGGLRVLLLGGLRGTHLATATGSVVGVSIENLNPTEEVLGGLEKGCDDESGAFESDTRGGKRLSLSLSLSRARVKKTRVSSRGGRRSIGRVWTVPRSSSSSSLFWSFGETQ